MNNKFTEPSIEILNILCDPAVGSPDDVTPGGGDANLGDVQ